MSFEGSAIYYRLINEMVRDQLGGLNSAELIMRSVNFESVARMQVSQQWDEIGRNLASAANGLERAGADCILICAVTMHFAADVVENAVGVPLIHVVDETARRLLDAKCRKPILLATRPTLEHGFYAARMARHGIDVLLPDEAGRAATHRIIFDELCQGRVLEASRRALIRLIARSEREGADSVIFGCTEIGLLLDGVELPLPAFNSTSIHAQAAVNFALGSSIVQLGNLRDQCV
jgi:aspartate racemase